MKHEWLYFWGHLPGEKFFHFARFNMDGRRYSHLSYDGCFYEGDWIGGKYFFKTPILQVTAEPIPNTSHIIHSIFPFAFHYTIPFLEGVAQVDGREMMVDLWLEFESMDEHPSNWEWLSFKLGDGTAVVVYKREKDSFAKLIKGDKELAFPFIIEGDKVILHGLGTTYQIEAINPEIIFHPTNGRPYSEQPILIMVGGKKVGYGMREKTYKKREE